MSTLGTKRYPGKGATIPRSKRVRRPSAAKPKTPASRPSANASRRRFSQPARLIGDVAPFNYRSNDSDSFFRHYRPLRKQTYDYKGFGLPLSHWAIGWQGCGYSPWYFSLDWHRRWLPWYSRRAKMHQHYRGISYYPQTCLGYMPFSTCHSADWLFSLSLPYTIAWINHVEYADGWSSPYQTQLTVAHETPDGELIPIQEEGKVTSTRLPGTKEALAQRYVDLADGYFQDGRFTEAAENYLRALTYEPNAPSLYFALADALFASGDYNYAAYAIRKGTIMDPELVRRGVDKRLFYKDPTLFIKQLKQLEEWVKLHPRDNNGWLVLGYNQFFSLAFEAALKSMGKVAELVPGDKTAEIFLNALPGK